jgi:hypothetical protein
MKMTNMNVHLKVESLGIKPKPLESLGLTYVKHSVPKRGHILQESFGKRRKTLQLWRPLKNPEEISKGDTLVCVKGNLLKFHGNL